jgi:hypothetical protein
MTAHQGEGDAVREADFLVRELCEEIYCSRLVVCIRAENDQRGRAQQSPSPFRGEGVGRAPGEQCECLVQNEVAREAAIATPLDFSPGFPRSPVVSVARDEARQEAARVDEDHFSLS